jgi:uncharacterized protein RhaS with RHS repeats
MGYSPNLGRWLTQDPIGYEGGDANLYRFVGNSPTNFTDPSGLLQQPGGGQPATPPSKGPIGPMGGGYDPSRPQGLPSGGPIPSAKLKNDEAFRKAARQNGVPDGVIDTILGTAYSTGSRNPSRAERHNLCEQWADRFADELKNRANKSHGSKSIQEASKGGIVSISKRYYLYRGYGWLLLDPDQDHTVIQIKLKDGRVFNVDVGILAAGGEDEFFGELGRITPADQIPKSFELQKRQ